MVARYSEAQGYRKTIFICVAAAVNRCRVAVSSYLCGLRLFPGWQDALVLGSVPVLRKTLSQGVFPSVFFGCALFFLFFFKGNLKIIFEMFFFFFEPVAFPGYNLQRRMWGGMSSSTDMSLSAG